MCNMFNLLSQKIKNKLNINDNYGEVYELKI